MVIALLFSSLALADIPPPDAAPCRGAEMLGKACTLQGTSGTCQEATRTRATPDGSVDVSYLACRPDPAAKPTADGDAAAPGDGSAKKRCSTTPAMSGGLLVGLLLLGTRRRS